jgi:MtfA peptidase
MLPLNIILILLLITVIVIGSIVYHIIMKRKRIDKHLLKGEFPSAWRYILNDYVKFYRDLELAQKSIFEKRVQVFLATKKIEPIDTEIDDTVRLMVAASSVIPLFAFPEFNYPDLREVLIYPNSFDQKFRTERFWGHEENVVGMVGNRFMNATMIISKPELMRAYDGEVHQNNVGIHEFAHLIDGVDGATDGTPKILIKSEDIPRWLRLIEEERLRIDEGASDINNYALKSNAEFFAVVSEYFFGNPEKFDAYHPELYQILAKMYKVEPRKND